MIDLIIDLAISVGVVFQIVGLILMLVLPVVSRCLDLGTPQQKNAIAQAMSGHISILAADTYGSHVVQRALDEVPGFDQLVVNE